MNRMAWMVIILIAPICCCFGAGLQEEVSDFVVGTSAKEREVDFIILRLSPTPEPTPAGGAGPGGPNGDNGDGEERPAGDQNDEDENGDEGSPVPPPSGPVPPPSPGPTPISTLPSTAPPPTLIPTAGPSPLPTTGSPLPPTTAPTIAPTAVPPTLPPTPEPKPPTSAPPTSTPTFTPTPTPLPVVGFSRPVYTITETAGLASITVTLDMPAGLPVTVDYTTGDGTAVDGSDYLGQSETLIFESGQTNSFFSVPIIDDLISGECPPETITLTLSNPHQAILGLATATLTIIDDDSFTVTTTDDPGEGVCDQTHCSLREAINAANTQPGLDTICFNLAGPGRISPTSPLPVLSDPVIIDGTTQPGAGCADWPPALLVEVAGGGAGADGLRITGGGSTIRGLVINGFANGVRLSNAGGNILECNFIGTDAGGTAAVANTRAGVLVDNVAVNLIGGTASTARNLIAGNSESGVNLTGAGAVGNQVQGNYIGVNVTGQGSLGNGLNGVHQGGGATNNTIGGGGPAAGNLIAYNKDGGIRNDGGHLTVSYATVSNNNRPSGNGGGILSAGVLTLTNSLVSSNTVNCGNCNGGGVYLTAGRLAIAGSEMRGNTAVNHGGGLATTEVATSQVTIDRTTFSQNAVTGTTDMRGLGGAIFAGTGRMTIADSAVLANTAKDGGGLFTSQLGSPDVIVRTSEFSGNTAAMAGGAIYADRGTVTVTSTLVSANEAADGGGLYTDPIGGPTVAITTSDFSGNTAANRGGAIAANAGLLTVANSTLARNRANDRGGAIFAGGGRLTIVNSTLSGNTADQFGGGLFTSNNNPTITITSTTIFTNTANQGGGIRARTLMTPIMANTIVAGNSGGDCFPPANPVISAGFNLDSDDSCIDDGVNNDITVSPPASLGLDPQLQDNGGSTRTHALLSTSPAIDRIPAGVNGCGTTVAVDQRGFPRPVDWSPPPPVPNLDDGCDLGAFEVQ